MFAVLSNKLKYSTYTEVYEMYMYYLLSFFFYHFPILHMHVNL